MYILEYFEGKRLPTIFLQGVVVCLGVATLAFLLYEPQIEGRNINSTQWEIYFNDPFLVYAYTASVFYFTALYQAFILLLFIRQNKLFTQNSANAMRIIKLCAMTIIVFVVLPLIYLFVARPEDDIAGGVAMGLMIIFISFVVAIFAHIFGKQIQKAILK